MKAPLIFNDLSFIEADSVKTANEWLTNMMSAIAALIYQDICTTVLHAQYSLYDLLLTDEYGFQEWLEEDCQDELRLLLRQLDTQIPAHRHLATTAQDKFVRSTFHLRTEPDKACEALGITLVSEGISISLPSTPLWRDKPFIEIIQTLHDTETLIPFETIYHRVRSVSSQSHVEPVVQDWRRQVGEKSRNRIELMENWKYAFPHLDMCREYESKFLRYLQGDTFSSVVERLRVLDDACYDWSKTQQQQPTYPINARLESRVTMECKDFANLRLATCPHLGKQYFVMHCNIQPNGYRLYWLENRTAYRITVCYVGPHLKTVKF